MPTPVRKKNADGTDKSDVWWLRKKVPQRYRALVGRGEIWRSLETTDRKAAGLLCVKLSAEFDRDWEERHRAAKAAGRTSSLPAPAISARDLSGLQRLVHEQTRDARIENPPSPMRSAMGMGARDEEEDLAEREYDEADMDDFLARNGYELNEADRARFLPMFLEARREAHRDLYRAARDRDFSESPTLKKYAPNPSKKIDFPAAFEFYCERSGIKGGSTGATAKRWRPKIKAFCDFVKHTDLGRMTTDDGYRWVDHLIELRVAKKSVRDVWIASLKATASFMVERRKLDRNPFAGIRIRGVKGTKDSNKKGFSDAQAGAILQATLATPSHLTTPETRAARRWVPWVCAYTGARVNEITSLLPSDVRKDPETGIWCIYLRPEMTKGDYERVIPVHSHLIEQKFLEYVEERRKARLPLFYDPKRARGSENANPQWQKIAQRLGDWVVESLRITGVKPNHGWRHRFKSVARHVEMHVEVEKFITGHGGSDDPDVIAKVSMEYGDPWVKTLKKAIEMYPRYDIVALRVPPGPHRRVRRTRAQIAAEKTQKLSRRRSGPSQIPSSAAGR
jgi:integrase